MYLGGSPTSIYFPAAKRPTVSPSASASLGSQGASSTGVSQGPNSGGFVSKITGLAAPSPAAVLTCSGTINWNGSAGDNQWSTAGNWDLGRGPTTAHAVCVN